MSKALTTFFRKITRTAVRDIRRAVFHLRHNGALLTFIIFLAAGMWFAGSYLHHNPLMMQSMDTRAGCDVESELKRAATAACAK